ncbi:MAG: prepilin-type N-terminal cleavage/methylation domain-containing protein [Atribacterota bacterium]|jgi:type II secretion system protein G|nr:prepilin-type N-terminal cleavage/methylation domain-containing protein [Atribacterota bacterium]
MWSVIRKKQNKKGEEGFTLIELIVVIAILGFLLAIAIPRYNTSRARAAVNASAANLKNLANAIELYATENNMAGYPTGDTSIFENIVKPYIPKIPLPPGGQTYQYNSSDGTGYTITDPNTYGDIIETANDLYVTEGGILHGLQN